MTTQTPSNSLVYNHLVPTHNSIPVESTALYPCQRHPLGSIATQGLSKAIPWPTNLSNKVAGQVSSSDTPTSILQSITLNCVNYTCWDVNHHNISGYDFTYLPHYNRTCYGCSLYDDDGRPLSGFPEKIAQPSHAKLLAQEPISQNIYLSSPLPSLPYFLFMCCFVCLRKRRQRPLIITGWGRKHPQHPRNCPSPKSRSQKYRASSRSSC